MTNMLPLLSTKHLTKWLVGLLVAFFGFYLLIAPAHSETPPTSAGSAVCEDGMAGIYPCDGIDFLSFMSIEDLGGANGAGSAANLWGWTDPDTNREYVIMGLTDSTAFVDISDPLNPVLLGNLPTETISSANYRDMKVYQNYAFIIADTPSEHGMQVFDLTKLRNVTEPPATFSADAHFNGFASAHNIHINAESGYAYVMRMTEPVQCSGAVYMVNIQDPLNPSFAGCLEDGGAASDTMCVNYHGDDPDYQGREICATASDDDLVIHDVTDKDNPVYLGDLDYPTIRRAHNTWFTADHNYFLSSDMNDEMMDGNPTRIFLWDISDVDNVTLAATYEGPTFASDHNVWVHDGMGYIGNFRAGMRTLDLSDIANGNMTAGPYFDMVPDDDNVGHTGGAWAVYPYFESTVIAVSEKQTGMYLLRPTQNTTAISLTTFDNASTSMLPFSLALTLLAGGIVSVWLGWRRWQR